MNWDEGNGSLKSQSRARIYSFFTLHNVGLQAGFFEHIQNPRNRRQRNDKTKDGLMLYFHRNLFKNRISFYKSFYILVFINL